MFVDVQKALLFYSVIAWVDDFTGAVIDYGTWPEQQLGRFDLLHANPTIQNIFPRAGLEAQIYKALEKLFQDKMPQEWKREDGALLKNRTRHG